MNLQETLALGAITGVLVFTILTSIRGWWRRDLIRRLKSEEYKVGWHDCYKDVKEKVFAEFDRLDSNMISKERK